MLLALDQATSTTGYSIWDNDKLIKFGHFTFTDEEIPHRFHKLCNEIKILCQLYRIDTVVIEDIQMQAGNVATFQKLAQVQGAILETVLSLKLNYMIIKPSEWRAECHFLKGQDKHRESQKKIAQTWAQQQYQIRCTQDEADAICIGYATIKQTNNQLNWE